MKISIICSDITHPVFNTLQAWKTKHDGNHSVELVQSTKELTGGDILFLISCSELVKKDIRDRYVKTLVIHASNLPEGRGWSPHIWQIIEGKNEIMVSLLEAEDKVDSGAIWKQQLMKLEGHELYNEINDKLFAIEGELMDFAVENFIQILPVTQSGKEPTYYRKRTPDDSRLNPDKSIAEQFDLLRVADPARFPAFFYLRGCCYKISIEKSVADGVGE